MGDRFGLILSLLFSLICIIKYKQFAKFLVGDTKNSKSKWSRKIEPIFAEWFF